MSRIAEAARVLRLEAEMAGVDGDALWSAACAESAASPRIDHSPLNCMRARLRALVKGS